MNTYSTIYLYRVCVSIYLSRVYRMLGAGLQFGRSRGEDRFYNPAKARSSRRGQLNQDHLRRALSDVTASQSKAAAMHRDSEIKKAAPLPPPPVTSPLCNLERFLESVIPSVTVQDPIKVPTQFYCIIVI